MGFKVDYDAAKVEGKFEMVVTGGEMKQSATSGNPYASFDILIRDDIEQEHAGYMLHYVSFSFTPKAMFRVNKFSEALGIENHKEYDSPSGWVDDCIGRHFAGTLVHDEDFPRLTKIEPSFRGKYKAPGNKAKSIADLEEVEDDGELPF